MCGVAGFVTSGEIPGPEIIKTMTDVISHRGPDGEGYYHYENFYFGHRRLAIVDLSDAGHQPMHYMNQYVITYNGEIYNHVELREELSACGYEFHSSTDTEVILAAYDCWGDECLKRFNGMWSFVIFDKLNDVFFISRDRFGIKPLYFYQDEKSFVFSSEIKSLLKYPGVKAEVNNDYISEYISSGPKEHVGETSFKDIYRFPASSYVSVKRLDVFKSLSFFKFWELKPNTSAERFDEEKAKDYANEYYEILEDSVKLRLRADVKVGSALSGGLDSSSIVYLVNKILKSEGKAELQETFSSVYASKGTTDCDESLFINLVAAELNVNSHKIEPLEENIPDELEKLIWYMENPPESTCMSGWHTFKIVREKGVVVTLDGQGADEQLAGYFPYFYQYFLSISFFDVYKEALRVVRKLGFSRLLLFSFLMAHFKLLFGSKALRFLIRKVKGIDIELNLNKRLCDDLEKSLITLIHYSDRVSMGNSVESRMPFMDYRLVEFLASVPACYKIHAGWTKYIARLAFDKKLPDEVCWRKDKMGWPVPEEYWFRGKLASWLMGKIGGSHYFSGDVKEEVVELFKSGKDIRHIVRYLNVSLYHEIFFKKK